MGYQQLNYFVDNYTTSQDFKIKGKTFDSGKTDVFLSQRNFRLQTSLTIRIEKSTRTGFFISANDNHPFHSQTGLTFIETDAFFLFREKQFLKRGNESLLINTRGNNLLKNNISANAGILLRF